MNMERTSLTLIEGYAHYVPSYKHYETLLVEFKITKVIPRDLSLSRIQI